MVDGPEDCRLEMRAPVGYSPFSLWFVIGSNWFGAGQREAAVRCLGHRGMLRHLDSNSRLAFRTIGELNVCTAAHAV